MRRNELDLSSQVAKNLITNPAMVTKTSGTDTVLTNLAPNPDFTGATVTMGGIGGAPASWTTQAFATDKAHSGTRSWKLANCTVAGQAGRKMMLNSGGHKVLKGQKISWSFWIYSTVSGTVIPYWEGRKVSDNSYIGGGSAAVTIAANTWTYVSGTATINSDSYVEGAGGYNLAVNVGDSVWWDDFCITQTDTPVPYFDGSTPAADGYTYAWSGTANNSPSIRKAAATVVRTNLVANPSFKGGTLSNIRTNLLTNPSFENATTTTDVWTNHVTNPSFRTTNGTVETRRNLVTNPSFEAGSGTLDVRTNLATNPSMETTGSTTNTRSNLAVNPSFETASGTVTVRTNLASDPRATVAHTTNNILGWRTARWFGGGSGTGTHTFRTGQTDGPSGLTTYLRKEWTTAGNTTGDTGFEHSFGGTAGYPVSASQTYTVSSFLRVNSAASKTGGLQINLYDSAGVLLTAIYSGGLTNTTTFTPGTWTRLSHTFTTVANSAFMHVISDIDGGTNWVAGESLDGTGLLVEQSPVLGIYFDGSTPISNLVTNPSFATDTAGWSVVSSTITRVTNQGGDGHVGELSQTISGGIRNTAVYLLNGRPGQYSVSFDMKGTDASFTNVRCFFYNTATATVVSESLTTPLIKDGNFNRYSFTFTATDSWDKVYMEVQGANIPLGTKAWIDRALILNTPSASSDYFEGTGDFAYAWSGTADASTSIQTASRVASLTNTYNCAPVMSSLWSGNGTKSMRLIPTSSTTNESFVSIDGTWSSFGTLVKGRTYTVAATLRLTAPLTSTLHSRALSISYRDDTGRTQYTAGTNTAGEQRIVLTFTVPATGTTYGFIEFHNGASVGNGEVWWDDVVLEEGTLAGAYFDGDTPLTNLATNPSYTNDTSGWSAAGTATLSRDTSVSYVGPTSLKLNTGSSTAYSGAAQYINTVAGKYYTVSAYVYIPTGSSMNFACDNLDSPPQAIVGNSAWQRIRMTGRAKGASTPIYFRSTVANQTPFWIDGVLVERSMTLNPFFEGTGEFTYAWAGTAHGSMSYQRGTVVTGYGIYNAAAISSTQWKAAYGTKSLKVVPITTSGDTFVDVGGDTGGLRMGMQAGKTYTVSATVRLASPLTGTIASTRSRKIVAFTKDGTANYVETASAAAPNAAGETRLSVTFTIPTGGTEAFIRLYHGGFKESGEVWYDNLLIEESPVLRPYFDGTVPAEENLVKSAATALNAEISHTTNVTYAGSTWTRATVISGTGFPINRQYVSLSELDNGETYTASVTVANDQTVSQTVTLDWCDTASVTVTLAPGETRRIKTTSSRALYDSTFRFADLHVNQDAGGTRSVLFKDWMIEKGTTPGDFYFAGTGDFTYAWTGTANASTSVQRAVQVTGVSSVPSLCRAFQSSYGATAGSKTLRVTGTSTSTDVFAEFNSLLTGYTFKADTTYTLAADRILPAPLVGASGQLFRANIGGVEQSYTVKTAATNVAGRSRFVIQFKTGSSATLAFIRLYSGTPAGGGDVWFDRLTLEEGFTDGTYFDGTTPVHQNLFTNPSVETSGALLVTNTNYLLNPLGKLNTNVDVGPNVTVAYNGTTGAVVTHTNGAAAGNAFYGAQMTLVNGTTYYARAVLEDVTGTPAAVAGMHSNVGAYVGTQATMTRVGNTLVRDWSFTSNYSGTGRLLIDYSGAGTGESFRVKEMIVADRPLDGAYFDGSTSADAGGYTYLWGGVANSSISRQQAPSAPSWSYWSGGTGGAVGYRWSSGAYVGSALYRVKWHTSQSGSNLGGAFVDTTVVGGRTYSSRVKARVNRGQTLRLSVEWYAPSGAMISTSSGVDTVLPANTWTDLKIENITAPSYATLGRVTIYSAALGSPWVSGDTLDVDAALFEEGSTARLYYEGTGDFTYAWVGTADASASTQKAVSVLGNTAARSTGVGYTDSRFTVYQGIDENGQKISRWFSPAGSPNSQWRVANISAAAWDYTSLIAGSTYTLLMRYRSSGWGATQNVSISLKDATSLYPIMSDDTRPLNTGWTEYRRTFTALIDGRNSTNLYISLPVTPQTGTDGIFDLAEWAIVAGDYKGAYFDGNSVSPSADMSYLWLGTVDASKSVLRGNHVNDVVTANFGDNNAKPITSTEWTASTGKSMRLIPVGPGSDTSITLHGSSSSGFGSMVAGKTYTVKATFRQAAPQTGTLHTRARGIMFADSVVGWAAAPVVAATNTAGSQTLTHTFTVNSAATWATVRLYNGASGGNGDVWWDDVVMVEGPYTGTYFDGNTATSGDFTHAWAGTANSSVSYQKALSLAGWSTESKLTAWITAFGTLRLEVKDHNGGGGRSIVPWQSQDVNMAVVSGNKYTIKARGKKLDSGTSYRIAGALIGELPLTTSMADFSLTLTAGTGPIYLEHPGRSGAGTEWEYFGIFNEGDPVIYFDGDTSGHDGLTYRWKGTPNVSQSEQIGASVAGYNSEANIRRWALPDGAMRAVNITGSTTSLQTAAATVVSGKTYTLLFRAKTYAGANVRIHGFTTTPMITLTPSYAWYRVSDTTYDTRLYFATQGGISGAGLDISHMMVTEGTYTGGYIDGSSYGARWDGTAHASSSLGNSTSLESMAGKPLYTATAVGTYTLPGGLSATDPRTIYTVIDNVTDLPTSALQAVISYGHTAHDDVEPNRYLTLRQQSSNGPTNMMLVRRTGGGGPGTFFASSGKHIAISGIDPSGQLFSAMGTSSLTVDPLVMDVPHEKLIIYVDSSYHKHVITYIYAGYHTDSMRQEIVRLLALKHNVNLTQGY